MSNSSHRGGWLAASQRKVPEGSTPKTSLKAAHQQVHTLKTLRFFSSRVTINGPHLNVNLCDAKRSSAELKITSRLQNWQHFCQHYTNTKAASVWKQKKSFTKLIFVILLNCSCQTHASKQICFHQSWKSTVFFIVHFFASLIFLLFKLGLHWLAQYFRMVNGFQYFSSLSWNFKKGTKYDIWEH